VLRANATDEDQIEAAVRQTAESLGRLDILINMAGIYVKTPSPSGADWSGTLDTNAKSAFLFSTHAAPVMKASGGGRIVNFADWLPVSGRPRYKG
jgi:NAD(P)-dependent dehydrogenase (short-subunit alcohol dehydrogenase family)